MNMLKLGLIDEVSLVWLKTPIVQNVLQKLTITQFNKSLYLS